LIIEWSHVHHATLGPVGDVTFQAILGLNSGEPVSDAIVFNYPDLDTGNAATEGHSATVGVKDVAYDGDRLVVSYNSESSFVGTGKAIRLIVAPPGPSLYVNSVTVAEGDSGTTNAVFTVTLANGPTNQTVTVAYATADAGAVAPGDYLPVSGTLTFAPGTTTRTVSVPIVGDTTPEQYAFFYLRLSNAVNAVIRDGEGRG